MKKILIIASVMLFGFIGANAAGTNAGTQVTNNATLSYDAGGVTQPSVNATPDEFVVDRKIDMILSTTDTNQLDVTPGQIDRVTNFTFKNEGNSGQNFKFTVVNLIGGQADYDADADTEETEAMDIEYDNGGGWTALPPSGVLNIGKDATVALRVKATIPTDAQGGVDGAIMNIELRSVATDAAGTAENETTNPDAQSGTPDIVFADGVDDGTLGETTDSKGDTEGDGKEVARSGYKIQTPILAVTKTSCVLSDPVNDTVNPKRIPGATIWYQLEVKNTGTGAAEDVEITDTLNAVFGTSATNIAVHNGACPALTANNNCGLREGAAEGNVHTGAGSTNVMVNFENIGAAGSTTAVQCGYIEVVIQ